MINRTCEASGTVFAISDADLDFYKALGVPVPTLAPNERQRRRIAYRNFRSLKHRVCGGTGKKIVSMYGEDCPFPVYDHPYWWSDAWDAKQYARDIDFTKPFFEQYQQLSDVVPRFAIANLNCENCEYSNFALFSRNCYLIFGCVRNEDCLFGHIVWDCQKCVDTLYAFRCQWCSNSVDIVDCYDVHHSQEATNCQESYFLYDCAGCKNCFGCFNLRNKQYCIFNEQFTRDEYTERLKKLFPLRRTLIDETTEWLAEQVNRFAILPELYALNNEDVSGNHIYESSNLEFAFDAKKCETSKYLFTAWGVENSYDISFTANSTKYCVECLTVVEVERVKFSHQVVNSHDVDYSQFCYSSHDLFGCMGLRNAEYCIFNRQYARDEYFQLRSRLIEHMNGTGEWGEFFPVSLSPFAYNESIVNEYFPLSKKEVLARGWRWAEQSEYPKPERQLSLPETVAETSDAILNETLHCKATDKPYRITRAELEFYRRMQLPLPEFAPDTRHLNRMALRLPRVLRNAACANCAKPIQTAQPDAVSKRVLCEECYLTSLKG